MKDTFSHDAVQRKPCQKRYAVSGRQQAAAVAPDVCDANLLCLHRKSPPMRFELKVPVLPRVNAK